MSLLTPNIMEEAITNIMENKCKTKPSLNNDFELAGNSVGGPYCIYQIYEGYTIFFLKFSKVCQRKVTILEKNTRECVVCYETDASLEAIISGNPQNIMRKKV